MAFLVKSANDPRWGSDFGDSQHFSHKRRPFISVYDGAAAAMLGKYLCAYTPEQREEREAKSRRSHGWRPIYRINVWFKVKTGISPSGYTPETAWTETGSAS
jgi:hypothetical protein